MYSQRRDRNGLGSFNMSFSAMSVRDTVIPNDRVATVGGTVFNIVVGKYPIVYSEEDDVLGGFVVDTCDQFSLYDGTLIPGDRIIAVNGGAPVNVSEGMHITVWRPSLDTYHNDVTRLSKTSYADREDCNWQGNHPVAYTLSIEGYPSISLFSANVPKDQVMFYYFHPFVLMSRRLCRLLACLSVARSIVIVTS